MHSDTNHAIAGAIIAGGSGSRMNGQDKCLLSLGGHRILDTIINTLQRHTEVLVLNSNGDVSRFEPLAIPVITDNTSELRQGPLAGIIASMQWVAEHAPNTEWLLTTASDTPFLPHDYVQRFIEQLAENQSSSNAFELCISVYNGREHYLNSLWRLSTLPALQSAFNTGERSIKRVKPLFETVLLDFSSLTQDPFFNINTHGDYRDALQRIDNT